MANGFAAEIGPVSRLPFEIFDDRFGAAAHVELLVNVVYVRSDGFQPNTKLVGRFLQDQPDTLPRQLLASMVEEQHGGRIIAGEIRPALL